MSLISATRRARAIDLCTAIAERMEPQFLQLEGFTIVSGIVLGETWLQAVDAFARIQVRADPQSEEHVGRLLLAFRRYCQRVDRRSTPAAFRERTDACRRITESVAQQMSEHLGRRYIAFEASNPHVPFRIRRVPRLDSIPFAVGIAEIDGAPPDAGTTEPGEHRAHR